MPDAVRFSHQTLAILTALLRVPSEWRYGYDLSRETGVKSGTLYPILVRLSERSWLETRWQHAEENGKPRHMYRLTAEGRRTARKVVHAKTLVLHSLTPGYRKG